MHNNFSKIGAINPTSPDKPSCATAHATLTASSWVHFDVVPMDWTSWPSNSSRLYAKIWISCYDSRVFILVFRIPIPALLLRSANVSYVKRYLGYTFQYLSRLFDKVLKRVYKSNYRKVIMEKYKITNRQKGINYLNNIHILRYSFPNMTFQHIFLPNKFL